MEFFKDPGQPECTMSDFSIFEDPVIRRIIVGISGGLTLWMGLLVVLAVLAGLPGWGTWIFPSSSCGCDGVRGMEEWDQ